jgi:hypothetical protein
MKWWTVRVRTHRTPVLIRLIRNHRCSRINAFAHQVIKIQNLLILNIELIRSTAFAVADDVCALKCLPGWPAFSGLKYLAYQSIRAAGRLKNLVEQRTQS